MTIKSNCKISTLTSIFGTTGFYVTYKIVDWYIKIVIPTKLCVLSYLLSFRTLEISKTFISVKKLYKFYFSKCRKKLWGKKCVAFLCLSRLWIDYHFQKVEWNLNFMLEDFFLEKDVAMYAYVTHKFKSIWQKGRGVPFNIKFFNFSS